MTSIDQLATSTLPDDGAAGALAGRVWLPRAEGPAVVALRGKEAIDVTRSFATIRDLCESADPAAALRRTDGDRVGLISDIVANTPPGSRDREKPWLLA